MFRHPSILDLHIIDALRQTSNGQNNKIGSSDTCHNLSELLVTHSIEYSDVYGIILIQLQIEIRLTISGVRIRSDISGGRQAVDAYQLLRKAYASRRSRGKQVHPVTARVGEDMDGVLSMQNDGAQRIVRPGNYPGQ